ncbi:MAG: AAA family ATPase [Lachnospiraceae bacterium]
MMKIPSILKPDLHVRYLENKLAEKVTYLKIPMQIQKENLIEDVKNGAVQFQELVPFLEKEQTSNYVVISTENEELGYMAVTYLEACRKNIPAIRSGEEIVLDLNEEDTEVLGEEQEKGPDFEEFQKVEEDVCNENERSSCYEENKRRVPIIGLREVQHSLRKDSQEEFFLNDLSMQGERNEMDQQPFWMSCRKESVCILNYQTNYFGFGRENDEEQVEALSFFEQNDRVYILNIDDGDEDDFPFYGMGGGETIGEEWDTDELSPDEILKNEILLRYIADELVVSLPKEKKKVYYKQILQGFFRKNQVTVSKGFSYDQVLNLIFSMQNPKICQQIERVVRYAIKDKGSERPLELSKDDFQFIDRFRKSGRSKKKKGEAKKRLMEELVGMDKVKEQVLDVVNVMKFNKMREQMMICENSNYHNVHVMLGAPGTAKTTVAELMGQIMVEEKLLPNNRFISINGAELKGMYVGHSAPKTKSLFERYDIIVIDEAYSLVDDSGKTDEFSKEAIAQLIIELEEHATDKLVIFAGYGGAKVTEKNNKMRAFIESNPGIKSRITSTFYFDSYSADEMVQIFYRMAKVQKYKVDTKAKKILREYFATRVEDETFGNGREARSLLENSVIFAAKRVFAEEKKTITKEDMQRLTEADIASAIERTKKANDVQNANNCKRIGFGI